jgi:hypothetical protein
MAVLALIQSYPYDEILGGDAAYILALAKYLKECGNEIHGLVTDVPRGRTNPFYRSAYAVEQFSSWRVRNAIRIGKRAFFAPHRSQPARILNRLSSNRVFAESSRAAFDR